MKNKKQIIFIHGGDGFRDPEKLYTMLRSRNFNPYQEKKYWREAVIAATTETHECHTLKMPNPNWADYTAWSIWFEKMVPYMRDEVVLVGHSLGGGFLLRYVSENKLPVPIAQLHLVAPVVTGDLEDCEGFTTDLAVWQGFKSEIKEVHLWHSSDDPYVPIAHSEALLAAWPKATLHSFTNRGHFIGEDFPELLTAIQRVV